MAVLPCSWKLLRTFGVVIFEAIRASHAPRWIRSFGRYDLQCFFIEFSSTLVEAIQRTAPETDAAVKTAIRSMALIGTLAFVNI